MDYITDNNFTAKLSKLSEYYNFPDFVKKAHVETKESLAELPNEAFADPFKREYPIHTKAATVLSQAYLLGELESLFPVKSASANGKLMSLLRVGEKIQEAANWYGLENEFAKMASALQTYFHTQREKETQKIANSRKFAYVSEEDDTKLLPINNEYEITKSARELTKYVEDGKMGYGVLGGLDTIRAAENICKAASDKGIPVPHKLREIAVAAQGYKNASTVSRHLATQVEKLQKAGEIDEEAVELYKQAFAFVEEQGLTKELAKALDALDVVTKNNGTAVKLAGAYPAEHLETENFFEKFATLARAPIPVTALRSYNFPKLSLSFNPSLVATVKNACFDLGGPELSLFLQQLPMDLQRVMLKDIVRDN